MLVSFFFCPSLSLSFDTTHVLYQHIQQLCPMHTIQPLSDNPMTSSHPSPRWHRRYPSVDSNSHLRTSPSGACEQRNMNNVGTAINHPPNHHFYGWYKPSTLLVAYDIAIPTLPTFHKGLQQENTALELVSTSNFRRYMKDNLKCVMVMVSSLFIQYMLVVYVPVF